MRFRSIKAERDHSAGYQPNVLVRPGIEEDNPKTYGLFDPNNRRIYVPFSDLLELFGITSISLLLKILREREE